jgi:hypothetical protein
MREGSAVITSSFVSPKTWFSDKIFNCNLSFSDAKFGVFKGLSGDNDMSYR